MWRAPCPQRLWGAKAFCRVRSPGCRGPQFQPPASLPDSPAPPQPRRAGALSEVVWAACSPLPGRLEEASRGVHAKRAPSRRRAGRPPSPGARGSGRGVGPRLHSASSAGIGMETPAALRPNSAPPRRTRDGSQPREGTAPGRPILTQPESPERRDRSCGGRVPLPGWGRERAGCRTDGERPGADRPGGDPPRSSPHTSPPIAPAARSSLPPGPRPGRPSAQALPGPRPLLLQGRAFLRAVGLLSPAPNARASSCLKGPETPAPGLLLHLLLGKSCSRRPWVSARSPGHWNWGVGTGGIRPSPDLPSSGSTQGPFWARSRVLSPSQLCSGLPACG